MKRARYTKDDVARILDRATELEASHDDGADALTLSELLTVGEEAGLARGAVLRAAREHRAVAVEAPYGRWLGAPASYTAERTVEGTVPSLMLDQLLETLRLNTTGVYSSQLAGRTLFYTVRENGVVTIVAVTQRSPNTQIRVMKQLRARTIRLHLLMQGVSVLLGLLMLSPLGPTAAFLVAALTSLVVYGATRYRVAMHADRERASMARLVDAIESEVHTQAQS